MSEIELIAQQIEALDPQIETYRQMLNLYVVFSLVSLFGGFIIAMTKENIYPAIIGSIGMALFLTIAIISSVIDSPVDSQSELIEELNILIKEQIKQMSCTELREDILTKILDEHTNEYIKEHDEFQKDLYYHKCEIPLREEVIKLQ